MLLTTKTVPYFMGVWVLDLNLEFDWNRVEIGAAGFIITFVGLLLGPVVGFLGDRFISIRRIVVVGLVPFPDRFTRI